MNEFQAVILAAGEGKRMKSEKSKLVFTICEKPLISWVTKAARQAGAGEVTVVVGHKKEQVMEALCEEQVNFAVQEVPQGTGHAVMMARPFFENREGAVLVLNGDAPLVSPETIKEALAHHERCGAAVTVLSSYNPNPKGYGRIVTDGDKNVLKIVEEKDATDQERKICEVNSGMYVFCAKKLCAALSQLTNDNAQGEYYLTDTVAILRAAGERVSSFIVCDEKETWGVNDRVQLANAQKVLQRKINEKIALSGVTITDLEHTSIGPDVTVGRDTEILPGTILEGKTEIGENCIIGPNTRLSDMTVGDGCDVAQSVGVKTTMLAPLPTSGQTAGWATGAKSEILWS